MARSKNLSNAAKEKNDEFYTQLSDIENELKNYREHFRDKIIFCNCDDPEWSNFWRYFELNFDFFGLKKLVSTHYETDKPSYKLELLRGQDKPVKTPLKQNGDFRSPECIELLKECDIVITNPPFSLFREYVALLMEHKKKFVIWGNNNAIAYKEFFPLLKENEVWLGYLANKTCYFQIPDTYTKWDEKYTKEKNDGKKYGKVPAISVFTNLDIKKRHEDIILFKEYTSEEYPTYDNYDAIEVSKVSEIPKDYTGVMGVPITFMNQYNPDQFEIIGLDRYTVPKEKLVGGRVAINGKPCYARILIRKKGE